MLIATQDIAKPEDGRKFFGPSNIVGSPKIAGTRAQDRHTVANVTWRDISSGTINNVVEQIKLSKAISKIGYNETSVSPMGCTSRGEAQRLGHWILATEYTESETIEFTTGYEYAHDLMVGEVIRVNIDWRQVANLSGRIADNATAGEKWVLLDAVPADTREGIWTITFHTPDGEFFSAKILEFKGEMVRLDTAVPVDLPKYTTWTVESEAVTHSLWRVSGVGDNDDGTLAVSGTAYNPSKFKYVDEGANLDDMVNTALPTGAIAPPSNVTATPRTYVKGNTLHQGFTVSWTPADDIRVTGYTVETMAPGDSVWVARGETFIPPLEIDDERAGLWKIRVISQTELGQFSQWAYAETNITSYLMPVVPENIQSSVDNFQITLTAYSSQRTTQDFEFWRANTALETEAAITTNAVRIGLGQSVTDTGLQPGTTYYYYVRGFNSYGVSAFVPYQAKTKYDPTEVVRILHGQLGDSSLSAELATKINTSVARLNDNDGKFDNVDRSLTDIRDGMGKLQSGLSEEREHTKTDLNDLAKRVDSTVATTRDETLAAVQSEATARTTAVDAEAKRTDSLVAQTDQANRKDWGSAIQSEASARQTAISAQAEKTDTQISQIVNNRLQPVESQLQEERKTRADNDAAEASARQAVNARVDSAAAGLEELRRSTASDKQSLAEQVSSVSAKIDNQVVQVQQQTTAKVDALSGQVSAQHVVKIDSGGSVVGYGLALQDGVSDFAIRADRFYVTNPNNNNRTPVFSVQGGEVYMNSAVIANMKVGRGQITDYLNSDNWWYQNEQNFGGLELNFSSGTLHCNNAIISGDINARNFRATSQLGDMTCEITGQGIVIRKNGSLVGRFGIWG